MGYRVTAPYVTVDVQTVPGEPPTTLGFYKDAVLPGNVDPASVCRQVAKGMVEEFTPGPEPEAEAEKSAEPVAPARPGLNGSKADWLAYAISQRGEGVSEEQARAAAEPMTKAELAAKYNVG